ncbi:MAG: PD-(D/E)XK nuclease family protein [Gammaproteobacteria bacterium]|nr:MAG: PD-(D/E)XK nuclease family protein [Gammaproteobacteria bacterium]
MELLEGMGKRTVVTANQRLAHHLTQRFHAWQRRQGKRAWESPDILPLSAWIERTYEEAALDGDKRLPLSPFQEQVLWQRIIEASPYGEGLLHAAATAKKAQEAWSLLHAWHIPLESLDAHFSEDVQAFLEWAKVFRDRCQQEGWLDTSRLPEAIAPTGGMPPLALGFLETTPQQQALFQRFGIEPLPLPAFHGAPLRVAMTDRLRELEAAAKWAKALIEDAECPPSIAILMPDLPSLREQVIQCFDEHLCPPSLLPRPVHARPYNLSLGRPLGEEPVVQSALLSLRLLKGLTLEETGLWLRSPFLGEGETERLERALLDARLRERRISRFSLHDLLEAASGSCPGLATRLRALSPPPPYRSPRAWARAFDALLRTLGWPGERSLSSQEYQALQAWKGLLEAFSGLGGVWPSMSLSSALAQIEHQAHETLFQPQTPEVPIQVLGMLEAIGMTFDHLWVMGLDDNQWPPAPAPNPFIPLALQRRHNLPGSSAERELAYARRITRQLARSAPRILFSHPLRERDQAKRPSPLIAAFPQGTLSLGEAPSYPALILRSRRMETFSDVSGPPLPPGTLVEGGKDVFKLQSACPFRAFARLRLGATSLARAEGFNAADRGILLHRVMERLWRFLESHGRLCDMGEEALGAQVSRAIQEAVEETARRLPHTLTPRLAEIEKARLFEQVMACLALEKGRSPFRASPEVKKTVEVGGIAVCVRADRVDVLEGGEVVIMDYKTGEAKIQHWEGERPEDPQLPLYALGMEGVAALCLAQVSQEGIAMEGIAAREDIIPRLRAIGEEGWQAQLKRWAEVLERLGRDFQKGCAQVDPKDAQACRYCEISTLCRIHER